MGSVKDDRKLSSLENEAMVKDFGAILGRLRSQLLDLTARNRLVNFRYTRRSLRFAGAGLDGPYNSLLAGKSLHLQYVPLPSDGEANEHPPARDYAAQLGLPTSYELEYTDTSTGQLQTLLYPKDLDRVIRVMQEENRLATDEAGSHILFLVSGFLQYTLTKEAGASKYIAPLLLLPVQFCRGDVDPVSGLYTYYLESLEEEDEVRDNITLREKLNHELGFQLPVYEKSHSPSSYLQEISDACGNRKGWQILPYLSLVLLSFKKIALWADLDVQKDQILVDHPLMRKLFGIEENGSSNEELVSGEEENSIDEHPLAELPFIYDADSSQHRALIDALEGKNLVIVGPPGTGKSQTITNLIATSMGRGKSVLFVSEKKAALDVVAKRLEAAGLGPFCLELHSNKSCKKVVLGSLEQRLHQTFLAAKSTQNELRLLREMRQQLNAYAAQINKPIDIPGDPTVHDLLWKVEKARQLLEPMAVELRSLCWSDALQWRADDVSHRRKILADLGMHYDQLGHGVPDHPLKGVAITSLSSIDRSKMEDALRGGIAATTGLSDTFVALHGSDAVHSLSIENCTTWQATLKLITPCACIGTDFAQRLQESSSSAVREALELIKTLSTNLVESNQLFPTYGELNAMSLAQSPIDDMSIAHLTELAQHFVSALSQDDKLLPHASLDDLEKLVAWFRPSERHQFLPWSLERMRSVLAGLAALPFSEDSDIYNLFEIKSLDCNHLGGLIAETLRLIHQLDRHRNSLALPKREFNLKGMGEVPWEVLKVLHEVLSSAPHHFSLARTLGMNEDTWDEALKKVQKLSQEQQQLSTCFLFDQLPTTEVLQDCLQTAREADWWSFICRRIRRAQKLCHRLWCQASTIDIFSRQFDHLLFWCQERDEFLSDPARKTLFEDYLVLGGTARETLEALSWWDSVRQRLANISVDWKDRIFYVSSEYGTHLFEVSENTIRYLEIDQKNIYELFQINTALYQHQVELAPYYLVLKTLIPLMNKLAPFAPSITFIALIEVYQRLMHCCSELNTLGQSVDHSFSWDEFKSLLRKQLSEVEFVVQRFQSLAPASLTPRQINSAIHARQRAAELRACVQAHSLLGSLTVPSSALDVEELALLEKTLSWWLQVKESGIPSSLSKRVIVQPLELNRVCDALQQGLYYMQQWSTAVEKLRQLDFVDCVLGPLPSKEVSLDEVRAAKNRFQRILTGLDGMDIWIAYNRCKEAGMFLSIIDLIQHLEAGRLTSVQLSDAFDYVYYHSCVYALYKQCPDLPQYIGYTLEDIRRRFSETDRKIIRLNGINLGADIARRPVPEGRRAPKASEQTELVLLEHEMAKSRRHLPIRQLMMQAGRAIQALKPCFLMSPLSVAQYLPKSSLTFDLLVIDEASQMRLPEAFASVLRAKQIVVVGDPKQLPPSNFFEEAVDDNNDEDEDGGAIEEADSILERCLQVFKAPRQLRWHYRSRHQNLIAFSNYHFYDNRLIILPACHADNARVGVHYNYISDGIYINRTNRIEAEKIVEAVISQLLRDSVSTVGVVTLNQPQREMIDEIFEQKLREIPALREVVEQFEACGQKVFIRNLENVQGDERDIIFISTVYGKMPGSVVVRQTFGPVNGSSGWRRLNVLFTRARQCVELYTSMQPEDIVLNEQSSVGHRILKHYLEFAQNGQLAPINPSVGEVENPFEEAIAELLRRHGYDVRPQLGVQGYWIDLVVCHPDKPGEYLAAIECDGATYHSSRSARDRDRIRQQLLEALGWKGKIFRIWSTDWFTNPVKQSNRLLDFLALLRFPKPKDD